MWILKTDKKRIEEIVNDNYVYASVLHYFGIDFYATPEETLEEACAARGLNPTVVMEELERAGAENATEEDLSLFSYPVGLIISYLKHSHQIFIKRKLPYLASLICNHTLPQQEIDDLKLIFPIFVEDFIYHIYEEEDTLFTYIQHLDAALNGPYNIAELYYDMERHSIQKYAMEHDVHDDEMRGIRKITSNYHIDGSTSLHVKVLYSELQAFETLLKSHAHIENGILFPRALTLENEVKAMVKKKIVFN